MKTSKYVVFSVLLSVVLCSSYFLINSESVQPYSGLTLEVWNRDSSGNVLDFRIIKGDLILKNKAIFIANLFRGTAAHTQLKSITNTLFYPQHGSGDAANMALLGSDSNMQLGTGTSAPDINDYSLNNPIATLTPSSWTYTTSGTDKFNITIVGTWSADGGYEISESGLIANIESSTGTTAYDVLMVRDTFDAFSVISGNVITVKYIWIFNR